MYLSPGRASLSLLVPFALAWILGITFLGLPAEGKTALSLASDPTLVAVDEAAPESDPAHHSNSNADLTKVYAWLAGPDLDTLIVTVDFASIWDGMHLIVALETKGDAAGAPDDPFDFPVIYGHPLKPDYVFTYKYSAQDYADLRRWNGRWEFWKPATSDWTSNDQDAGKNSVGLVTRSATQVQFRFPTSGVGAIVPGAAIRLEAYVTQEVQGTPSKYTALDSSPQDSTHNMVPPAGNWWDTAATDTVTLSQYGLRPIPAYGAPPALSEAKATPDTLLAGDEVVFSARAVSAGGGIGNVFADLTAFAGDWRTPLRDDGTGGDAHAGDGIFSVSFKIPEATVGGTRFVPIAATDSTGIAFTGTSARLVVGGQSDVFKAVEDAAGDDHGPSIKDGAGNPVAGLYYLYPTNGVFKPNIFDLRGAEFMIDGSFLVVRLKIGNVLSSSEGGGWGAPNPGSTCASPNKAQMNQPKIDIYIDTEEGAGSTAGFPNRVLDIASNDAWEYGVAVEGWWKGFVTSNGKNTVPQWTINKQNDAIDVCNDYVEDYIDVKIGLAALGNPTRQEIKTWDFIITMSCHDGTSTDANLGDIRVVNSARTEWQFGGGRDAEGGRNRDTNIIDVLAVPGDGKAPGRSQQVMLNYQAAAAQARFAQGLNSCELEATAKYPGSVAGTVAYSDTSDVTTVATITASSGGKVVGSTQTAPGGGTYEITSLPDAVYDVQATAPSYRKVTTVATIQGGTRLQDVDFNLIKVPGAVSGTVSLTGPRKDARVYVVDASTGELGGDGIKLVKGGSGAFQILAVEDGSYHLIAQARGYARYDSLVTIAQGAKVTIAVALAPAVASNYAFIDSIIDVAYAETYGLGTTLGNEIRSIAISRSLPAQDFFDYGRLLIEPRDDNGSAAIFDVSALDSIELSATLLDPAIPARGSVVFADTLRNPLEGNTLTAAMFKDGVCSFLVRDDSVEVLRVAATRGTSSGAVEVGVGELRPARVSLDPLASEITAGGRTTIGVQLVNISGSQAPVPDVEIRMGALDGVLTFEPEIGTTDANGFFQVYVSGTAAGTIAFTAAVEPGEFSGLPADTASIVVDPAEAYEILARPEPGTVKAEGTAELRLQVVDRFGNAVATSGLEISLTASPAELLAAIDTPVTTDAGGAARSVIEAGPKYGVVAIDASAALPVEKSKIVIDSRLVALDQAAPEDARPHSNPNVDLTTLLAWLAGDSLKVAVDFASSWQSVLVVIALETRADAAGGEQDPFTLPIYYRHALRPDFVFTYKYSSDDYADLRRWGGSGWEFWDLPAAAWVATGGDTKNAKPMVAKTETRVVFTFPLAAVGALAPGDTIRLEAYVAQQFGDAADQKYTALDSDPPDNSLDMLPAQGNWYDTATMPRNLSNWAEYVFPSPGAPPTLSSAVIVPSTASPGDNITLRATVADAGGGIGDVLADLSPVGGDATARLNDAGTAGDEEAGDGVWTTRFTIPAAVSQGAHPISFTARDSLNISQATASATVTIVNPPEVIISVEDPVGDDHGPNITAGGQPVEGLYYFYPTNGVFAAGVFDITRVNFMIDGPFLVIRVYVGELPSSEAVGWNAPYPAETCTDPNKADLNLQKIDVYIDSKEGAGATAGLPFRYVDIARSDAWEFAAVSEGWWKGLIQSNGENSISFWTIQRQSSQIDFCDNHLENYIDVQIALSALGDPTAEDIKKWDFVITMSGHDGTSDDQNLGGSRWVNRATSEWQFGGGRDSEAGRDRDANIIDVVTVPGTGKAAGRSQGDMLNYLLDDAARRFDEGKVACQLEATSSVDVSPPAIAPFPTDGFAHAVRYALENAPVAFITQITDENDIDFAEFAWRPLGETSWRTTPMVNMIENFWIADVDPDVLRGATSVIELVDGTPARAFEARVRARDQYGNEAQTPLITFAIPEANLVSQTHAGVLPATAAIFYDGTIVIVPAAKGAPEYDTYDLTITPLAETGPEDMDFGHLRSSMTYLDVARKFEIVGHRGDQSEEVSELVSPVRLALHYPTYLDPEIPDEQKVGIFEYNDATDRWIGIFGAANAAGNAVAADVTRTGIYALFSDSGLGYDAGEGLSGVRAEPNPFSPNGDGLYDETLISFFLSREADWVTVEIYDISGEPVRTIKWQQGLSATGRNAFEIVWDGRDDTGEIVPYGIYVLRVEVRFKVAPYNERQNIGVVVVK